ncbi:hypothetical protein BDN70DRAFT_279935 [Pholiota conissans]|uniref:Uncharacterized protein n=1 Tax=Pholiota conissans TaxID=109636 RepID=A0A9P6D4P4_9AGAR|nr:hypothetical protein BDN70DRAFT_279935 [Pholiota conissans]
MMQIKSNMTNMDTLFVVMLYGGMLSRATFRLGYRTCARHTIVSRLFPNGCIITECFNEYVFLTIWHVCTCIYIYPTFCILDGNRVRVVPNVPWRSARLTIVSERRSFRQSVSTPHTVCGCVHNRILTYIIKFFCIPVNFPVSPPTNWEAPQSATSQIAYLRPVEWHYSSHLQP